MSEGTRLTLEGLMWSSQEESIKQLLYGYMALVKWDQGDDECLHWIVYDDLCEAKFDIICRIESGLYSFRPFWHLILSFDFNNFVNDMFLLYMTHGWFRIMRVGIFQVTLGKFLTQVISGHVQNILQLVRKPGSFIDPNP